MQFDNQQTSIRTFILKNIESPDLRKRVVGEFGISRQAFYWHIKRLLRQGVIKTSQAREADKGKRYELVPRLLTECYAISLRVQEDQIWRERVAPFIPGVPDNVMEICQHGFTEIVNNCLAHSESETFHIRVEFTPVWVRISIGDQGVGIFNKIQKAFDLADKRYGVLELTKGKLTTDPEHHTGEGIFFTSRIFDRFSILSSDLYFTHRKEADSDWLLEDSDPSSALTEGTFVTMEIATDSTTEITKVFLQYASPDNDYLFTKTHVPVTLARYGNERLVSRSQAKRVLSRFEEFREVMLDFSGVESIGQPFADEIFRVFRLHNPNIEVRYAYANQEVERMILRANAGLLQQIAATPKET
jgi:anti-sigma regulatory factor (Ser/Thr protein kinase)/DNA-binding transcriptional ArsR family regulator